MRPRDYVELRMTQLFRELLGNPDVAYTSNFFEVGGSSILAVGLLLQVHREFAVNVPLDQFLECPTPETLANVVRRGKGANGEQRLVTLAPGREPARKLYLIHGIGGEVYCYRALRFANLETPVMGIRAVGIDGAYKPLCSFQKMADSYADTLLRQHTGGPYNVGGHCMAGLIGFEVARQVIERAGRDAMGQVLVFDTTFPSETWPDSDRELLMAGRHPESERRAKFFTDVATEADFRTDDWDRLTEEFRRLGHLTNGTEARTFERRMQIIGRNLIAEADYRPKPLDVEVVAIFGQGVGEGERDSAVATWKELASAVTVLQLDVGHWAMFESPQLHGLIDKVCQGRA